MRSHQSVAAEESTKQQATKESSFFDGSNSKHNSINFTSRVSDKMSQLSTSLHFVTV